MIDGVVRAPSAFSMTFGWPFSMIATHELVVPRSIPMILPIVVFLLNAVVSDGFNIGKYCVLSRACPKGPQCPAPALLRRCCRHDGRTQQAVGDHVALLQH